MKFHAYDTENGVGLAGAPVTISIFRTVPPAEIKIVAVTTNTSGWATYLYTPQETARFSFTALSAVNYSTVPGFPPVGMQTAAPNPPGVYFNVTARPLVHVITNEPPGPIVIVTTTPPMVHPVPSLVTLHLTTQATQVTPATQNPQVTPATQSASPVPATQTDTTPPVTTLTLAGTEDGSGGYSSDVTCTLAAADNAGGSGVSVTQYSFEGTGWNTYSQPVSVVKSGTTTLYYRSSDNAGNTEVAKMKAIVISRPDGFPAGSGTVAATPAGTGSPLLLWLIAIIIFAAVGGALYLKSRPKKEEPEK